jgi:copper chaperone NosL
MKGKLSIISRILVAFASGALIAVFFLPAWRIDLFAPQYPEGLTMKIWINGISGDVDVINGLNHYIGMKHITVDMFPEFKFLSYVVVFFMLLGMFVAISGSRKFLFVYLILTLMGGALAMYDFYQWGYDYGHNLDKSAPIQVPGLSYQPPLFGHKKLLNFDAYSFPDVSGWIVIGAGILAFTVWFVEWYRHRRPSFNFKPAYAAIWFAIIIFLASCSVKPEPVKPGEDNCYLCKMGIIDPKFAGEVITKRGKVYKFDDIICMARFLKSAAIEAKDIHQTVITDFEKQDHFLDADNAFLQISVENKSPMHGNALAFDSKEKADKFDVARSGLIMNWKEFYSSIQ